MKSKVDFPPALYSDMHWIGVKGTRRERLKSAPYLRLKKRKKIFLEKNL